uniref:MADF domain-containing protein n=1 Tax=Scylla olivacea TaxID=85551 RepID=A0A0P4WQG1_SCYOL
MANWNYHDTEVLISEIERRPCLWDPSAEDYKDKIKKTEAWVEVYTLLYPDYEEKKTEEKQQIGKEVQSRLRNIRDAFMKDCKKFKTFYKSGSGAVKFHRYVFADQLGFLGTVSENRETTSSLPSNHTPDEGDEGASGNQVTVQPVVHQSTKKRKMSLEEKIIQFMEGKMDEPDPDHDFLKCIFPSVQTLQKHQKFNFRIKVLTLQLRTLRPSYTSTNIFKCFDT